MLDLAEKVVGFPVDRLHPSPLPPAYHRQELNKVTKREVPLEEAKTGRGTINRYHESSR